jgi:imidazolonepropionase
MAELGIVAKGALLIRNGIIQEGGSTRRVENLAEARNAREIDATGRIVMPAFVDADVALVSEAPPDESGPDSLHLTSNRKVLRKAAERSEELARYGCVTAGGHTRCASDLRNITRLLRVHRMMQRRPVRIHSILSPMATPESAEQIISKWLPLVMSRKLASVAELTVSGPGRMPDIGALRRMVAAAAGCGYAIRLRSPWRLEPVHLELALEAGAIAVVAPVDALCGFPWRLTEAGTIRVIPAADHAPGGAPRAIRAAIGNGAAVALSSSGTTINMQHVLYSGVGQFALTPEEAITATTWNAACSLRLSNVTGSLEPGKAADLLVMDVGDYREMAHHAGHADASLVMRDGRIVYRRESFRSDKKPH